MHIRRRAALALLAATAWVAGRLATRRWIAMEGLERLAVSTALGLSLLAHAAFALGALGLLTWSALIVLVAASKQDAAPQVLHFSGEYPVRRRSRLVRPRSTRPARLTVPAAGLPQAVAGNTRVRRNGALAAPAV